MKSNSIFETENEKFRRIIKDLLETHKLIIKTLFEGKTTFTLSDAMVLIAQDEHIAKIREEFDRIVKLNP
jgi:hypothetical protein